MRRGQASKYLKDRHNVDYKRETLAQLAVKGGGPEFVLIGRFPFYEDSALDDWVRSLTSKRKFRSTAQYRENRMKTPTQEQKPADGPLDRADGIPAAITIAPAG
jgi:hypothetical protein